MPAQTWEPTPALIETQSYDGEDFTCLQDSLRRVRAYRCHLSFTQSNSSQGWRTPTE
jgi:hypothetical protein